MDLPGTPVVIRAAILVAPRGTPVVIRAAIPVAPRDIPVVIPGACPWCWRTERLPAGS